MKKITTLLIVLFSTVTASAQQIGDGHAPVINDFNVPLKSGLYNGLNPTGMTPDGSQGGWQHLLVTRHKNEENNYQMQISSSFSENDRLFFRKIVSANLSSHGSSWIEFATRGTNTFTGNQIINGNVGIGNTNPSSYEHGGNNKFLEIRNSNTTVNSQSHIVLSSEANIPNSSIGTITWALPNSASNYKGVAYLGVLSDDVSTISKPSSSMVFATRNVVNDFWVEQMRINSFGNVGIGTTNPKNKLDVNGTIHSKEVKVDLLGWSDFVFKKEYNLPTLIEVEKHINEKGHLENIPNEEEVLKNGINLGEMNAKLLQKIEELTLYMIDQNKNIQSLIEENKKQNEEIMALKKNTLSK